MSIENKYHQGYHIKFNNQNVQYTTIHINHIKTEIWIKLLTNFSKKSIQLHICGKDINKITILNSNSYNELIDFCSNIQKEKVEDDGNIITLKIKAFLDSINSSKGINWKAAKIKSSMELFNYLCINKWFVIKSSHQKFSDTVMKKLLQFIMDDFVDDHKNRDKMILFYLFLFHLESITANISTKTKKKKNHSIKTYSIEDKYDLFNYSTNNLDYYLDNL